MHRRRNSVSLTSPFHGIASAGDTASGAAATTTTPAEPAEGAGYDEEVAPSFELDNQEKYDLRRVKYLLKFCQRTHSSIVVHRPIIKATYTLFPLNAYADAEGVFEELAESIGRTRKHRGLGAHWSMIHTDIDIPDPEREGKTQFKENWPVAKRIAQAKAIKIPPGPVSLVVQTACLSVVVVVCLLGALAALVYM